MEATAEQNTPEDASSAPRTEIYHFSAASNPTLEDQLFELARLSEVPMSKQLFDVVVELLRLNIPPSAILHVMKTLRAQATQSTLPPSLQSTRAHTPPPPSSQSSSATRAHGEASKPSQKRSEKSHTSKPTLSQQALEADKSSRKHRQASSSNPGSQKISSSSSRSSEKLRSAAKGGSGGGSRSKGQTQDSSKKVG